MGLTVSEGSVHRQPVHSSGLEGRQNIAAEEWGGRTAVGT